jgi:hypothetical protein
MGVAVGDPFGDGRESLLVTNFGAEPNSLYRNVDGVLFEDAGAASGIADVGMPSVRWGTHFADFDNDGWPDTYVVGGHLAPRLPRWLGHYKSGGASYVEAGDSAYAQRAFLVHNLGGGKFVEWTESGDFGRVRMSARGTAVADLDGDGALDLVVVDVDGPVRIFHNEIGTRGRWIAVEPVAGADGRTVLGTRVRRAHTDAGVPGVALLRLGLARPAPLRARRGGRRRRRGALARRPHAGILERPGGADLPGAPRRRARTRHSALNASSPARDACARI